MSDEVSVEEAAVGANNGEKEERESRGTANSEAPTARLRVEISKW